MTCRFSSQAATKDATQTFSHFLSNIDLQDFCIVFCVLHECLDYVIKL